MMWEDDFYEPSEFDEKVAEWKEILRDSVKKEYQEEMERLRKENQELSKIKNNWDVAVENAEKNAKRTRLYELLKPFLKTAYAAQYEYGYIHEKCNKCDKDGYIHFKSPSGRDMTEQCECREKKPFYAPVEVEEFRLSQFITKYAIHEPEIIFTYKRDKFSDGDEIDNFCSTLNIYKGQDFSMINCLSGIIFFDKKDAQAYCDYLNSREGFV